VKKKILIEDEPEETRLAVLEDNRLAQLYIERQAHAPVVGNVYKVRVTNIVPAIQAAFVDIGAGKNGFLYAKEACAGNTPRNTGIDRLVKPGEEIIVQIVKEAIGSKGPRVSRQISLAGRFIVYLPADNHIGVSRRIPGKAESQRLRKILANIKPQSGGLIARTAAIGASETDLSFDCQNLLRRWSHIESQAKERPAPVLLHTELPLISRIVRDLFTEEVSELLVNSPEEYERILGTLELANSRLQDRVRLYTRKEPLFKSYGLEEEIEKALRPRVNLKSGGSIVIEKTESLVTVDVNSGKYISRKNTEETALRTNLEAAAEVARQLRLRDVGGIIVIDFIDMEKAENRKKVLAAFKKAVEGDRAKTKVLNISEFGVIEMTRERVRESLEKIFYEDCPFCDGCGVLLSKDTLRINISRQIRHLALSNRTADLTVAVPPRLSAIFGENNEGIKLLEEKYKRAINVVVDADLHPERFKVICAAHKEKKREELQCTR